MDAAEEDAADQDPQGDRDPTENSGRDGPCNRACAGNGRKMMSHEDRGLGGDVVHAVRHGVGRCRLIAFPDAPLFDEPPAVADIAGK